MADENNCERQDRKVGLVERVTLVVKEDIRLKTDIPTKAKEQIEG